MIYTVTLNPAIDYYMTFDEPIQGDKVNYAKSYSFKAGGKGINCSIVLDILGIPSRLLTFCGDFTGDFLKSEIAKYPLVQDCSVAINECNRINVKISGNQEIILNTEGPSINTDKQEQLLENLQNLNDGDYVMICGRSYSGNGIELIKRIANLVHSRNANVVIDENTMSLEDMRICRPFMIKPNLEELQQLLPDMKITKDNLRESTQRVLDKGVENVLVTMGSRGAYFHGKLGEYTVEIPEMTTVNSNGAGDATLAGTVGLISEGRAISEALAVGNGAGCATVASSGFPTKEEIYRCRSEVKVSCR